MNVLLKLNDGLGISLGPNFAIKANIGTVLPSTLTKEELLAGTLVTVDDLATTITIESAGDCTNSLTLNITSPTTTTTTAAPTTTTTTAATTTTTTTAPTTTTTTAATTTTTASPTTTTTAAPTTSTTTNNLPTTTTTSTTSTTTSTTTLAPVSFSTSGGCSTGSDGVGAMISFNGGSGVYQASDTTYADSASALAGTYTDVVSTRTFSGLAVGTYWVALRDKNNTSNKTSNSFAITACPTTTTTTLAPVTFDITYTCTGTTQTITISNFAGGDGTYYASTTTYADAGSAGSGATSLVGGTSLSYTTQPSSYGVSTRYVKVVSGTKSLVKSAGACCDTAANWVYQNNTTCVSCNNLPVYRDTNQCSPTYNYYKIDTGGTPQLSQPAYGACDTSANYSLSVGNYYTCSNGSVITTPVYQNTNTCFTGNQYRAGSTTYAANPANSYPNTSANWVNNGSAFCSSCVAYQPQIDTNPCSPTYNTTRNLSLGQTSPCVYTASYTSAVGTLYVCNVPGGGVNSYTVYQNTNPCFTGNQYYATNGSTYSSNPSNTPPDTTQNWQPNGANYCSGVDLYQPQIQTNPCAVNYGGTRNYLIQANSDTCAEVYVLSDCLTSGTGFSIVYVKNSFAVGDRVTSSGVTFVITSVTTTASAGSYVLTSTGQTGCPEYTQFYDRCTGAYYYILGTGYSGEGTSTDVPGDCLQVTGTTTSPSGSQIYNWTYDSGCECL